MNNVYMAWLCADDVYKDKANFISQMEVARIAVGSDFASCYDYGDTRFIAFRGSDDYRDWFSNAELTEGFREGADGFKEWVAKLAYGKDVVFCGHSRGGAIATFMAEYCAYVLQNPCSCITFGCPKPSKKSFRDYYNKLPIDHTNVYIQGDIVATSMAHYAIGYRHVGKQVELKSPLLWRFVRPYGRVKAHLRDSYSKSIKERYGV